MSELEKIQKIVENRIYNREYSSDELNFIANIRKDIIEIREHDDDIAFWDNQLLDYLVSKNFITIKEKQFILSYKAFKNYGKELSLETKNKFLNILERINNKIQEINNSLENTNVKLLYEKIKNGLNSLTSDDLDLLFQLINESEYSLLEKRDLLLYISLNVVEFVDNYASDYHEIDDSSKGMTREECEELLSRFGYSIEYFNEELQNDLLQKGNYQQVEKILELLQSKGINLLDNCGHNVFEESEKRLVELFIKSNANCINRVLDVAEKHNFYEQGIIKFYKLIRSTSQFILRKKKYKARHGHGGSGGGGNGEDYGSHQDFITNIDFFDEMCARIYGSDIDFFNRFYEKRGGDLFSYPHDKILETIRIFKAYGLTEKEYFESATSVFKSKHQIDILDRAIEFDMLDYLRLNPSTFVRPLNDEFFDLMYVASKNKETNLRKTVKTDFSGIPDNFSLELKVNFLRMDIERDPSLVPKKFLDELIDEMSSLEAKVGVRNTFKMFDEHLDREPFNIGYAMKEINSGNSDVLKLLEDKFKVDEYLYVISNIRISRYKVLRIYSALRNLINRSPELDKLILKYAISKNSYMTKQDVEKIIVEIENAKKQVRGM